MPWRLPEDLKLFKKLTMNHIIVMGRKTYDSIGKPLPGRLNVVISKTMPPTENVLIVKDLADLKS
ncbi:dihydrofolate reductase, partial [Lacticaseibacillus paracasei]